MIVPRYSHIIRSSIPSLGPRLARPGAVLAPDKAPSKACPIAGWFHGTSQSGWWLSHPSEKYESQLG